MTVLGKIFQDVSGSVYFPMSNVVEEGRNCYRCFVLNGGKWLGRTIEDCHFERLTEIVGEEKKEWKRELIKRTLKR